MQLIISIVLQVMSGLTWDFAARAILLFVILQLILFYFLQRKQFRILYNLRREIYLIDFKKQGEADVLKSMLETNGLFKVYSTVFDISNYRQFLELRQHHKYAYVVIYNSEVEAEHYERIIKDAKTTGKNIPVVFYAPNHDITPQCMGLLDSYMYGDKCITKSRLLSVVYNLAVIMPITGFWRFFNK